MKKFNFLSRIALVVAAIASISFLKSCKEEEMPFLTLSQTLVTASQDVQTEVIDVYTNASWWSVSVAQTAQDWLKILGPATGSYKGTFQFEILANEKPQDREATITVTGNNGCVSTLIVRQSSMDADLTVSPASITFTRSGNIEPETVPAVQQKIQVKVTSNHPWTASSSTSSMTGTDNWCKISATEGPAGVETIVVTALANNTGAQREAHITVVTDVNGKGRVTRIVEVVQAGSANFLYVTPDNASVNKDAQAAGVVNMVVTANCDWKAKSSDQANCSLPTTPALVDGFMTRTGSQVIPLTIAANNTDKDRQFVITLVSTTPGEQIIATFTVNQSAKQFYLDVASDDLTFEAESGAGAAPSPAVVPVNTNMTWTAVSSNPTDFPITFDATTITVSPTRNASLKDRQPATITVTSTQTGTDVIVKTFKAYQKGLEVYLTVEGATTLDFGAAVATSAAYTVTTNSGSAVAISSTADWCQIWNAAGAAALSPAQVNTAGQFTIHVLKNSTGKDREATIELTTKVEGQIVAKQTIAVKQFFQDYFVTVAEGDAIGFTADMANASATAPAGQQLTLNTNLLDGVKFNISSSEAWCTVSAATLTLPDNQFYVGVARNTGNARSAVITISTTDENNKEYKATVAVNQAAGGITVVADQNELVFEANDVTAKDVVITSTGIMPVAVTNPSWITVGGAALTVTGGTITIAPAAVNLKPVENVGIVKVYTHDLGKEIATEIKVIQKAAPAKYFVVDAKSIDVLNAGIVAPASFDVNVLTNLDVTTANIAAVSGAPSWCHAAITGTVIAVTVDANPGAARATQITVTGTDAANQMSYTAIIAVNQDGANAEYIVLDQTALIFDAAATTDFEVGYDSNPDVSGVAVSNITTPAWLSATNSAQGTLKVSVLANNSALPRTGYITLSAGASRAVITVTQQAETSAYYLTPNKPVVVADALAGGAATTKDYTVLFSTNILPLSNITAVSSNDAVATVDAAAWTSKTLTITVNDNPSYLPRTATITVTGITSDGQAVQATVTVDQAGDPAKAPTVYYMTPATPSIDVPATPGTANPYTVDVLTNITAGTVTATPSSTMMITATSFDVPTKKLSITVADNHAGARTAFVTLSYTDAVTGQVVTAKVDVKQAAVSADFITPAVPSVDGVLAIGETRTVNVATSTNITAPVLTSSNDAMFTAADKYSYANGVLTLNVAPNTGAARNAVVTLTYTNPDNQNVTTASVTVNQLGADAPFLSLGTSEFALADATAQAAATLLASVTTNLTNLTATSSAGWLTPVSPVVAADGLKATWTANPNLTQGRVATITVTGMTAAGVPMTAKVIVSQPGTQLPATTVQTFSFDKLSVVVPQGGYAGLTASDATATAVGFTPTYTVGANVGWITDVQMVAGALQLKVDANVGAPRTGVVTVKALDPVTGAVFTELISVNQAGIVPATLTVNSTFMSFNSFASPTNPIGFTTSEATATAVAADTWCVPTVSGNTINLNILTNTNNFDRYTVVTVTAGSAQQFIIVRQSAPVVPATANALTFAAGTNPTNVLYDILSVNIPGTVANMPAVTLSKTYAFEPTAGAMTQPTGWSVNATTGLVTMATNPGSTILTAYYRITAVVSASEVWTGLLQVRQGYNTAITPAPVVNAYGNATTADLYPTLTGSFHYEDAPGFSKNFTSLPANNWTLTTNTAAAVSVTRPAATVTAAANTTPIGVRVDDTNTLRSYTGTINLYKGAYTVNAATSFASLLAAGGTQPLVTLGANDAISTADAGHPTALTAGTLVGASLNTATGVLTYGANAQLDNATRSGSATILVRNSSTWAVTYYNPIALTQLAPATALSLTTPANGTNKAFATAGEANYAVVWTSSNLTAGAITVTKPAWLTLGTVTTTGVTLTAAENTTTTNNTGTVTITAPGGVSQSFTVSQAGVAPTLTLTTPANGGSQAFASVGQAINTTWTSTGLTAAQITVTVPSWLTQSAKSTTGVTLTAAASGFSSYSGTVTVSATGVTPNKTYTVTQAAQSTVGAATSTYPGGGTLAPSSTGTNRTIGTIALTGVATTLTNAQVAALASATATGTVGLSGYTFSASGTGATRTLTVMANMTSNTGGGGGTRTSTVTVTLGTQTATITVAQRRN